MEKKMMKSNGVDSRSSAMKRRRLFSAAAVLLICCLAFVGAVGAVVEEGDVAIIGDEGYPSIKEAIDNVDAGGTATITVIKDHELDCTNVDTESASLIYVDNKDITIDLNGKMVTADFTTNKLPSYEYSKVTVIGVSGSAKLTMIDSSEGEGTLYVKADEGQTRVRNLLRNDNGDNNDKGEEGYNLVIKGGNYLFDNGSTDTGAPSAIVCLGAYGDKTTWVKGGTFRMSNLGTGENGCPWIFNAKENNANSIVVTGGTFNTDINHQYWQYEVEVPENKAVHDNSDGTWTIVGAAVYVEEHTSKTNPHKVGYVTLEDAVSAIGKHKTRYQEVDGVQDLGHRIESETVVLLEDTEVTETLVFTPAVPTVFNMDGHKLIWKGNAGKPILTVSGNNKLVINLQDIEWNGHAIDGWYTKNDAGVTEELTATTLELTSTSLYAKKGEPNKYEVIFIANGAESGTMAHQQFTYDVGKKLAKNEFTKTGYTFTGWKTNPNGSESVYTDGQLVKNLTTINNRKVTLYANWTINQYTITFATDGGSTVESITQDYGTDVTAPADPTKDGYTFAGWDKEIPVTMPAENLEITAIWKEIPAEEEIITPPSSGGGGDGGHLSFPRFTENGGLVDFGSSKVVKALMLPEGSRGSVLLKVDTVEKWPKAVETEYPFDISVEKLGEGMAYIHFEIPESTLESLELTPADIGVYHLVDEVWVKLAVTYEVKEETVFYEAATDSFSPFKLVIEEGAATQKEEENVPTVPPTEEPDVPDEPEILPPIDEPTKPADEPETPAPILAVLAGLGAAFIVRRK